MVQELEKNTWKCTVADLHTHVTTAPSGKIMALLVKYKYIL